jgi:beta-galactosidase
VEHKVLSPAGHVIATLSSKQRIGSKRNATFRSSLWIQDPVRWDIGEGNLYSVVSTVKSGTKLTDVDTTTFGIRTIRFTADDGFDLTDRRGQMKGVNLHHDHGPLGAAFYPRAMERQLEIMVGMGCNAVRTSHNAAAPELLDMCDRMGILVQ